MPVIKFTALGGLEPSVPPRALPDNGAQVAENINPGSPTFRALPGDKGISTVAVTNPLSMYRFDRNADGSLNTDEAVGWKAASKHVTLARTQINEDVSGKIYYVPSDGSTPMRWHNAAGVDRQAGVPAPVSPPVIDSVTDSYVFTTDARTFELTAVLDKAVQSVLALVVETWVGTDAAAASILTRWLGSDETLKPGWLRNSDFIASTDPRHEDALGKIIRVFAVNPQTNAVITTFSDMPPEEAGWVFDSTLGGSYETVPAGFSLPSWAAGYTKFWCIPMRAYARAYDIPPVETKAALMALKMPGTQGSQALLTSAQADAMVTRISEHGDKDAARVAAKIAALQAKAASAVNLFQVGGKASLEAQTTAFYQRADVQATFGNAKTDFAEAIWGYLRMLGLATAPPYYQDSGGGS